MQVTGQTGADGLPAPVEEVYKGRTQDQMLALAQYEYSTILVMLAIHIRTLVCVCGIPTLLACPLNQARNWLATNALAHWRSSFCMLPYGQTQFEQV